MNVHCLFWQVGRFLIWDYASKCWFYFRCIEIQEVHFDFLLRKCCYIVLWCLIRPEWIGLLGREGRWVAEQRDSVTLWHLSGWTSKLKEYVSWLHTFSQLAVWNATRLNYSWKIIPHFHLCKIASFVRF